jgi:hypothetical protein
MTIWIIVRVALIIAVWLALFLALFWGYFTIPIIIVFILAGIYAISDAAFVVAARMREKAQRQRDEMLLARSAPDEPEPTVNDL